LASFEAGALRSRPRSVLFLKAAFPAINPAYGAGRQMTFDPAARKVMTNCARVARRSAVADSGLAFKLPGRFGEKIMTKLRNLLDEAVRETLSMHRAL
jgi:hypothetical protein